jgi:polysaccharide biosynthesis protein PslG
MWRLALALVPFICLSSPTPETKRLSFAILEDYDKGEDLHQVALDFDAMRELHVRTWRGSFGWDDYEPSRGQLDFTWLHEFADVAAANGITLRPYIGYTPAWAAKRGSDKEFWNDGPKHLSDWSAFAGRLASAMRRHSNVVSFEIYNEENVRLWWDGSSAEYNAVLASGARAIRSENSRVQILSGGMVWPDTAWIEDLCRVHRNGKNIDILPFHAYPETWTPPAVQVENYLGKNYTTEFLPAVDRYCGRKPIWINEAGFATTPGKSELQQANWWARAIATFAAAPRIEHIGIYEIKDAPNDKPVIGDAPNYYLGLLHRDRTKKIAFHTVQAVIALFNDMPFVVGEPEVDGATYRHVFIRSDGHQIVFVWNKTGSSTVQVKLPQPGSSAIEIKLDGERAAYSGLNGRELNDVRLTPGAVRMFEIVP